MTRRRHRQLLFGFLALFIGALALGFLVEAVLQDRGLVGSDAVRPVAFGFIGTIVFAFFGLGLFGIWPLMITMVHRHARRSDLYDHPVLGFPVRIWDRLGFVIHEGDGSPEGRKGRAA